MPCAVTRALRECRRAEQTLAWESRLAASAHEQAMDLALNDRLSHVDSRKRSFGTRLRSVGYAAAGAGENLAAGQRDVDDALQAWLASPSHCANLMQPEYRDVGLACVQRPGSRYRALLGRALRRAGRRARGDRSAALTPHEQRNSARPAIRLAQVAGSGTGVTGGVPGRRRATAAAAPPPPPPPPPPSPGIGTTPPPHRRARTPPARAVDAPSRAGRPPPGVVPSPSGVLPLVIETAARPRRPPLPRTMRRPALRPGDRRRRGGRSRQLAAGVAAPRSAPRRGAAQAIAGHQRRRAIDAADVAAHGGHQDAVPALAIDQPALVRLVGPALARHLAADPARAEVHVADGGGVLELALDRIAPDVDHVVVLARGHALLELHAHWLRDVADSGRPRRPRRRRKHCAPGGPSCISPRCRRAARARTTRRAGAAACAGDNSAAQHSSIDRDGNRLVMGACIVTEGSCNPSRGSILRPNALPMSRAYPERRARDDQLPCETI